MLTLQSTNVLDLLCAHVTMGGSSIDFCHDHNIRYDHLSAWLYDDPKRLGRYNAALDARTEWIIQRVLLELTRLATVDVREAFRPDGSPKHLNELSPALAACISSISVDSDGKQHVRFRAMTDKMRAMELLGKNFAMFIERHDHLVRGTVQVMPAVTVDDKPLRYDIGSTN